MKYFLCLFFTVLAPHCLAGDPLVLWPGGAPGALGTETKDIPTLTPYLPEKANGAAMLLIPGGSYSGIYEGQAEPFALWLNEQGHLRLRAALPPRQRRVSISRATPGRGRGHALDPGGRRQMEDRSASASE
jgi:hypothetical protein